MINDSINIINLLFVMATFNTFIHRSVVIAFDESDCINAIASNDVDSIRRIMQQMPSLLNRHFISDNGEIIIVTPNNAEERGGVLH